MRIYASRPRPARFHGFGQDASSVSLLPVLRPGATPVTGYDETVQARDRLVFREANGLIDIAYLGTIAPPVTIGATRGVASILLGYVYGPGAGTARYVPLDEFYRQGWYAVAPSQEGKVWEAGGIYRKPVYPYTVTDLDQNLDLIESWVKSGTAQAEAGNIDGAKHALAMARDNINNAWHRLNALRDSGLPNDLVESLSTLIRGMVEKSAPLQTAINESNAGAMAAIGRAIIGFFGSNVPAVQRAFSDYHRLARKKVIELYRLRKATEKLLREIVKLPQTGDMPKIALTLASELALLNQGITRIESEAAQYGMKVSELFDVPAGDLADVGFGAVLAPIFIAAGLSAKAAAVAAVVTMLIVEIILSIIVWKLMDRFGTKEEDVLAKDEVQKANKSAQSALVELIRLNFEKIMAEHPTMNFETAKELAIDYARISAELANVEELKRIIDPKLLKTLTDSLAKKGIVVGPLPGTPGSKQPADAASVSDDTLILVIAGIVVLGPILASLLRKN